MTHLENCVVARMVDLTILCETSLKDFKCRQREPYERPYGSRKQMQDQQVLRMPIQDDRISEMAVNTTLATNPTGFLSMAEHSQH